MKKAHNANDMKLRITLQEVSKYVVPPIAIALTLAGCYLYSSRFCLIWSYAFRRLCSDVTESFDYYLFSPLFASLGTCKRS